ncbi:hypothetical protein BHE74_00050215 [Ensete ventricosum]|nr:hypothetical protein BHE74_00050215 [Ensete ventricosum]
MTGEKAERWTKGRRVRKRLGLRLRTEEEDGVAGAGSVGSVNIATVRGEARLEHLDRSPGNALQRGAAWALWVSALVKPGEANQAFSLVLSNSH